VRDTLPARLAFLIAYALSGHADAVHASVTPDRALYWLDIAIGRGFINYPFLARYDPFTETLRTDPRFLQLMEIARDRWERFEA
jgi:hypothetical protein